MPELPEVEAARRQIEKYCFNHKIERVDFIERGGHARDGEFDEIVVDEALKDGKDVVGRTLIKAARKGKHIVWELSGSGRHLVFHFGMTGNFRIKGVKDYIHYKSSSIKADEDVQPAKKQKKSSSGDADEVGGDAAEDIIVSKDQPWPPRFTKAMFYFSDGICVAFTDPRRLGRLRARAKPFDEEPVGELAADPIHEMPSLETFAELVANAGTREIKTVLLDQNKIVCGIGNYLADECLHQAGIHPCHRTNELSSEEVRKLREAILDVCTTACQCLEEKKDFPSSWLFHGRWASKKDKDSHKRENVEEIKVGGRTTLFDRTKQVLHKGRSHSLDEVEKQPSNKKTKQPKSPGNSKSDKSTSAEKQKKSPKKKESKAEGSVPTKLATAKDGAKTKSKRVSPKTKSK